MVCMYRRRARGLAPARSCAICRTTDGILHFNLTISLYRPGGPRNAGMRGAGTIDLCEPCWSIESKRSATRRRPARPAAEAAAAAAAAAPLSELEARYAWGDR